jgi:hypothetical protein
MSQYEHLEFKWWSLTFEGSVKWKPLEIEIITATLRSISHLKARNQGYAFHKERTSEDHLLFTAQAELAEREFQADSIYEIAGKLMHNEVYGSSFIFLNDPSEEPPTMKDLIGQE